MSGLQIAAILAVSTVAGFVLLAICARFKRRKTMDIRSISTPVAFLFDGDELVHATAIGLSLLEQDEAEVTWDSFRMALIMRFPSIPAKAAQNAGAPIDVEATDPEDDGLLRIETVGRRTRVELIETEADILRSNRHDIQNLRILHDRLEEMCQTSPYPMWRLDDDGKVTWSNAAYGKLANDTGQSLDDALQPILKIPNVGIDQRRARASSVIVDTGKAAWFDVSAKPAKFGVVYHAANIDAVIQAEIAQRNFVQTLAKTFAQLATGLAIFDRNGQLVLFNPALIDLTGLPAEFLSARPELMTFFDRLRDRRAMPEPKNYANWRQDINSMVRAANEEGYQETWTLDSGYTYRVTGRPHPDGAVAFLIEDISAEVSLTRNFRAELEIGQSILNGFSEGIVVFSSAGVLTFCNQAYRDLWSVDPDASFADTTIIDSVRVWQEQCEPSPAWNELRDYVMKLSERTSWDATVDCETRGKIQIRVTPIASGATSVRFDLVAAEEKTLALKKD